MSSNELIFFITTLISLFFVLPMLRLGKQGLAGLIVANIILVSCFGALLIPLFQWTTNAGNVFYASIFLTTQVATEHYGVKAAFTSMWVGFGALVLFVLLAQYSIRFTGGIDSGALVTSMHNVFTVVPRIALASMAAYLISQSLNIWLFSTLRKYMNKRLLWLRSLASSAVGQLVDSIIFFSIAFAYTITDQQLLQAMAVGFVVKLFVAIIGIPVLYASYPVMRFRRSARSGE
jgi:uncharacterized integral membrane protein (TIGR00697 family)